MSLSMPVTHTPCRPLEAAPSPAMRGVDKAADALRSTTPGDAWQLQIGQVLSLRVRRASVLRVQSGTAWVTQRGPMPFQPWPATDSASTDSGDVFLRVGESLVVNAGQHLVLESANPRAQGLVCGVLARAARQP